MGGGSIERAVGEPMICRLLWDKVRSVRYFGGPGTPTWIYFSLTLTVPVWALVWYVNLVSKGYVRIPD